MHEYIMRRTSEDLGLVVLEGVERGGVKGGGEESYISTIELYSLEGLLRHDCIRR